MIIVECTVGPSSFHIAVVKANLSLFLVPIHSFSHSLFP